MHNIGPAPSSQSFAKILKEICEKEPNSIRGAVAHEALDHDDPKIFFEDLLHHGCASGLVASLIYYVDTHAFFDRYYEEIETIREEIASQSDGTIAIEGDLKNHFAWLAFEETAHTIMNQYALLEKTSSP